MNEKPHSVILGTQLKTERDRLVDLFGRDFWCADEAHMNWRIIFGSSFAIRLSFGRHRLQARTEKGIRAHLHVMDNGERFRLIRNDRFE